MKTYTNIKTLVQCIALVMIAMAANAQYNPLSDEEHSYKPTKGQLHFLGKTKSLRETTPIYPKDIKIKEEECKDMPEEQSRHNKNVFKDALPKGEDAARQLNLHHEKNFLNIDTILTAPGFDYTGIFPPDPDGFIGLNNYIQMVNGANDATFKILDKNGNLVYGPALCNTIWTQVGQVGWCDGVVLYDQQAQRWVLLELNHDEAGMLMAVSETSDPTGSYYAYSFTTNGLPDYPKVFIWNNGYYICTNENSGNTPIYALDRDSLLNGFSCNMYRFTVPKIDSIAFQCATGADWDGATAPPANSPSYIMRLWDDAWGGGNDHLEVWSLLVDWADSNNTVLTGPLNLLTVPFVSNVGNANFYVGSVPEPGGGIVESMDQILMNRVQYRNFGSYESIVCNHIVDANGHGLSGIRWYELRKSGTNPWSIYQQGTYAPDPTTNRFMGSIAQDGAGNIALGYTVTDSISLYPSLRIVARRLNDPLGTMTFNELQFATGTVSYPNQRWGDYSNMTVDPVDDRTFWFTGEYMGSTDWSTEIIKFRLKDSNDVAPVALIQPVTSGNLTNAEIIKVQVANVGYNAESNFPISYKINGGNPVTETITTNITSDSAIIYTFTTPADFSLVNGVYNVEIYTSLSDDDNRNNDTLRTQVIHLADNDAAAITVTGGIPYVCGTSAPFGFVLKNAGFDNLTSANINYSLNGDTVVTFHWTGNLPYNGTDTIILTLTGIINGTNTIVYYTSMPNAVTDQDTSNDITSIMFTDISQGQIIAPFVQGFELSLFPPQYWRDSSSLWLRSTACSGFGMSTACARYPFWNVPLSGTLVSPFINMTNVSGSSHLTFNVAYARYSAQYSDTFKINASTDCGNTWTNLWTKGGVNLSTITDTDYTPTFVPTSTQWRHEFIDITAYDGLPEVLFNIEAVSGYGNDGFIDDINIDYTTNITTIGNGQGITVYPNPSNGNFNVMVKGNETGIVLISVYNIIGEEVKEYSYKLNGNPFEINMDGQSSGIYHLKIETNQAVVNKTLSLIR